MDTRMSEFETIPGMLDRPRGLILYALGYSSPGKGDIVEIGSWQGRSTSFLAQACRDGGGGIVRAIDHFKGNEGTEDAYVVDQPNLSDLEQNFRANLKRMGLEEFVTLYPTDSKTAIGNHANDFRSIRLLFIDGDHSLEGVSEDVKNFATQVNPGGFIVFDDYHTGAPGVLQAVEHYILNDDQWVDPVRFRGFFIARKAAVEA